MATFSIDNDRLTGGIQDVHYDQTVGAQTPTDGDEVNVILTAGELDGLDAGFEAFLTGLGALLTAGMKNYAVANDAASSSATFIQVTGGAGETLNDLKLVADSTVALTGFQTLTGGSIYVHVDATGNYATLWTTSDNTGHIVGAVALTNEVINNTTHIGTAGVQLVFFEAIKQTNTSSQDESISLSNVLKVAVDTQVSFNFDALKSGGCLWAGVGTNTGAVVVSGYSLDVDGAGKLQSTSNKIAVSQGGTGTTIGLNNQLFDNVGETAVFTLVTGLDSLGSTAGGIQSDYIVDHTGPKAEGLNYTGYINTTGAGIFVSQSQGNDAKSFDINLFSAGGGTTPEVGFNYIGTEPSGAFQDDTSVDVATVTIIDDDGNVVGTWVAGADPDGAGPLLGSGATVTGHTSTNGTANIQVTISGNNIDVNGVLGEYTVNFTSAGGVTFNRFTLVDEAGQFDVGRIDISSGGLTPTDLGSHLFADDDGPTITGQPGGSLTPNDLQVGNVVNAQDSSSYTLAPGTDGQKSFNILGPADSTGDFTWAYYDVNGDSTTGLNEIKGQYKGSDLYTLVLNSDGTYTFKMIGTLPGSSLDLNPAEVIKAGAPDAPILQVGAVQNDDYVQLEGGSTVGTGNINESHGFVGVDNGNLDANESMTVTLHESDGDLLTFQGIQIGTKSAQGGTYDWTATKVGGGTVSGTETVGKNGTIDISSTDLQGFTVDSITITKVSGPATKIGLADIHIIVEPDDVQLGFTVELKDGDNDAVTSSFVVDIDGNNDGNYDATVNSLSILPTGPITSLGTFETSDGLTASHMNHHDLFFA